MKLFNPKVLVLLFTLVGCGQISNPLDDVPDSNNPQMMEVTVVRDGGDAQVVPGDDGALMEDRVVIPQDTAEAGGPDVVSVNEDAMIVQDAVVTDTGPVVIFGFQHSCPGTGERGCGVVGIPAGVITLGAPGPAIDALPLQPGITVNHFLMDTHEVTLRRFRRWVTAGTPAPCVINPGDVSCSIPYPGGHTLDWYGNLTSYGGPRASDGSGCSWGNGYPEGNEDLPMNCVSHDVAQAFCVWDGGRLPTEAEWELSGRTTDGRSFPWGDELPLDHPICDRAMWGACGTGLPIAVGSYAPSPLGLYDMAGNLSEHVADAYMPYSDSGCWGGTARYNPLCNTFGMPSSARGGSWGSESTNELRTASRAAVMFNEHNTRTGFRCAHPH